MSFYDIIPIVVMILSLAGIILIIVRKFPILAAIDTKSIKSEQEAEIKEKIVASRLQRKIVELKNAFKKIFLPVFSTIGVWFKNFYNKILELEKQYVKRKPVTPLTQEEREQKIKTLFFSAEEFLKEGNLNMAEEKYIEIITLDHKNICAYKKLGVIYLEQKNFDHASQTFQHILKLNPNDVETLIDLALLQKQIGENKKALENFQKAVALEPTNPKNLDFLIEMSIILRKKDLAKRTLEKLREVNPENQKLDDFEERIKALD